MNIESSSFLYIQLNVTAGFRIATTKINDSTTKTEEASTFPIFRWSFPSSHNSRSFDSSKSQFLKLVFAITTHQFQNEVSRNELKTTSQKINHVHNQLISRTIYFHLFSRLSISKPTMPRMSLRKKAAADDAEVETTTTKVPRKGVLGKMGLKKKSKIAVTKDEPEPAPVEEPAPAPVEEEPVVEEAPMDAPEEEPVTEEAVEEREEEPAEEPAEESPEEPAEAEEEVVEREQPEEATPSTGFLCGCV